MFTREKIPKHHRLLSRMSLLPDLNESSLYGSSHLREIFVLDIQNNFETEKYKPKELIKQLDKMVIELGEKRRNLLIESIDAGYKINKDLTFLNNTRLVNNPISYLLSPFISRNIFSLLKPHYLAIRELVYKFIAKKHPGKKEKIKEQIVTSILEFIKLAIGWNDGLDRAALPHIQGGKSIEKYYDYVVNNEFIYNVTDIFDFNNGISKDSYDEISYMTDHQLITIIETDKHIVLNGSEDRDELVQIAESVKKIRRDYKLTNEWYSPIINDFSLKVVDIIRSIYTSYIPMETILQSDDDPNILILPKDFRLQKGGTFKRGEPDGRNNVYDDFNDAHKKSAYFTTSIMTTLSYLTNKEEIYNGSKDYCENLGEIHVFKVRHDLRLLNLSNVHNVKYLRVKLAEMGAPQEVIEAFENGWVISKKDRVENLRRVSYFHTDYLVVNWLCENGFNGYLATHISKFHDEIVICKPSKNLKYMLKHTVKDFNVPMCQEPYNDIDILITDL
jgi:hypothetical protein